MKKEEQGELTASTTTAIDGFGIRCKFRCWTRIRTWTTTRTHLVLYFGCHGQECLNIDLSNCLTDRNYSWRVTVIQISSQKLV